MAEVIFTFWPLHRLANNTVGPAGPEAGVEAVEKRQISSHNGIQTSPESQATAQHYTDGATPYTIYNSIHYVSQYVLNMTFCVFLVTLPVRRLYCVIGR